MSSIASNARSDHDECGTGFPVVFVHGHPFDRTMWAPQLAFLQSRFRVVVPDLRGYGAHLHIAEKTLLSDFAADIFELLDRIGIVRFVLVGLSMGGQIALECHRQQSRRIAGLVLSDTFAYPDSPERRELRLATADRLLREGMDRYALEELPRMLAPDNARAQPDVAQHVLKMMRTTHPAGAAAALRGRAERIDYTPHLKDVRIPTLIIVGDRDEYTPVSDARFMHDRIAGSELVIIEGAGHLPNLERPSAFNVVLERFAQAVAAREGLPQQ